MESVVKFQVIFLLSNYQKITNNQNGQAVEKTERPGCFATEVSRGAYLRRLGSSDSYITGLNLYPCMRLGPKRGGEKCCLKGLDTKWMAKVNWILEQDSARV